MFSKQTQELRQKMLDDSQMEDLIGYVLSAVKELDQRLETLENAKRAS